MIDLATKLIAAKQGLPEECISLSHGWWDRFRLRHPQIGIRKPEKISRARMLATDRGVVNNYFDMLYETLSQNNTLDRNAVTKLVNLPTVKKLIPDHQSINLRPPS